MPTEHLITVLLTYLGIAATFVGMAWVIRVQSRIERIDIAVEKGVIERTSSRVDEDNYHLRRALMDLVRVTNRVQDECTTMSNDTTERLREANLAAAAVLIHH